MKPALILIHGAGLNAVSWDPVRRHLDPSFTVITPDLPGHGSRRDEPFTLAGAVETVLAAARQAGAAPLIVGGDSLGGYTSMAAASVLPQQQQLKGLVLAGCTANLRGFRVMLPFRLKSLMIRAIGAVMSPARIEQALIKQLAGLGLSEVDARATVAAGAYPGVFPQAVAAIEGVDFRAKVAAIAQPVLFLNGAQDTICINQHAAFLAAARDARECIFDGSGHGVSLLRSREFAEQVNAFAGSPAMIDTAHRA